MKKQHTFLLILLTFLSFTLFVNAQCPTTLSGFDYLGELNGHAYFISQNTAQPAEAQMTALQNNGYLAVINDQAENDFIQQNISEMTYIGLNDVQTEGNLNWFNGDPLNYTNVDPCSFCNENADDLDYVIIAPWDGAWSFSSQWNPRKYIVEVPCGTSQGLVVNCANPDTVFIDIPQNMLLGTAIYNEPTATTDCPNGGVTIDRVHGPASGSMNIYPGTHDVVYEITDACGNTELCVVIIFMVSYPYSTELICPQNITAQATSPDGAIVDYIAPSVVSDCPVPFSITNVSGPASGSLFPIGTTTVTYNLVQNGLAPVCGEVFTCTFDITVTDQSGGGCPPSISGFTTIGEFNGHKYFLSNETAKPADAQMVASQNGGYLVAINDQAENDFIHQNISEFIYIGLEDTNSEGVFEWCNGEPFIYDNINPCSSCNQNSDELDFLVMVPWDGEWTFSSEWTSRKYIVEIPCATIIPNGQICTSGNNNTFARKYEDFPDSLDIRDMVELPDCGYFLGGDDDYNGFLIYVDNNGEFQWQIEIPNATDITTMVAFPNQEDFLMIGKRNGEPFAIKFDNQGEEVWSHTYDGIEADYFVEDPVFLDDGNILLLSKNSRVVKLNELGDLLWEEYPFPDGPFPIIRRIYNMHLLDDGNLLFLGLEKDLAPLQWGEFTFIAKTDINLNPISYDLEINCCKQGGFLTYISSAKAPNGKIHLLMKELVPPILFVYGDYAVVRFEIDPSGNYIGPAFECGIESPSFWISGDDITVSTAGKILSAGNICTELVESTIFTPHPNPPCEETATLTISDENDCLITKEYFPNDSGTEIGKKVLETQDGGILLLGMKDGKYFLSKTDENGDLFTSSNPNNSLRTEPTQNQEPLFQDKKEISIDKVFPNPANDFIIANVSSPTEMISEIELYDVRGVLLKIENVNLQEGSNTFEISISDFPNGFYFIKIPQKDGKDISKRFVKIGE